MVIQESQTEDFSMPWKKGQVYQCPDEDCGCEVTVTKEPSTEFEEEDYPPTCCCGNEMELKPSGD